MTGDYPMTQLEKLQHLLDEFSVTYITTQVHYNKKISTLLTLEGQVGNVNGYLGFTCNWGFSETGDFVTVGIWE
jgi:hypothetical protein